MLTFYCIQIESENLIVSAGVNRIPLCLDTTAAGLVTVRAINEWIMPQANTFNVFLAWPPRVPYQPGKARLHVSVFRADPKSQIPKPAEVLAELFWPRPEGPELYPFTYNVPLRIANPPPTQLWTEAEKIDQLTDQDKQEILALVEKLRAAILAGRFDEAYQLTKYKLDEDARANGNQPAEMRDIAIEQYQWFVKQPNVHCDPLPPELATFTTLAADQVVLVGRGASPDTLAIIGDQMRTRIKIYAARINGAWRIVR